MDQPITNPISGSSLDFLQTCQGVNQDVREDPELDNIVSGLMFGLNEAKNNIALDYAWPIRYLKNIRGRGVRPDSNILSLKSVRFQ